jgi:hypothetical protein
MAEYYPATALSGGGWIIADHDFFPLPPEYLRTVSTGQFTKHLESSLRRSITTEIVPRSIPGNEHRFNYKSPIPILKISGTGAAFPQTDSFPAAHSQYISWRKPGKKATAGRGLRSRNWSRSLFAVYGFNQSDGESIQPKSAFESHSGVIVDPLFLPDRQCERRPFEGRMRVEYRFNLHCNSWNNPTVVGGLISQETLMIARRMTRTSLQRKGAGAARRTYLCMNYASVDRGHSMLGDNSCHRIPYRTVRFDLAFGLELASSRRGEELASGLDRSGGPGA